MFDVLRMIVRIDGDIVPGQVAGPAGRLVFAQVAGENHLYFMERQCGAERLWIKFGRPAAAENGCALKREMGLVVLESGVGESGRGDDPPPVRVVAVHGALDQW